MSRPSRRALPGPARTAPVHETPAARALDAAWQQALGAPPPFRLAAELARDGWTPQAVTDLAALAGRAVERRTGVTRGAPGPGAVAVRLARAGHTLALMAPLPVPGVLGWLAALAGAPRYVDVERSGGLAYAEPGAVRPIEVWATEVPPELGPLAWAAGLPAGEAAALHRAGTLDEAELCLPAALRGHAPD